MMARTHVEIGTGRAPAHHVYTENGRGRGAPSVILLVPRDAPDALPAALRRLHDARGPLDLDRRLGELASGAPSGTGFLVAIDRDVWVFPGGPFEFAHLGAGGGDRIDGPRMFRLRAGEACEIRDPAGELVAALRVAGSPAPEAARVDPEPHRATRPAGPRFSMPRPGRSTLVAGGAAAALVAIAVLGLPLLGRDRSGPTPRGDAYRPPSLEERAVDLLTRGAGGTRRSATPPALATEEGAESSDATTTAVEVAGGIAVPGPSVPAGAAESPREPGSSDADTGPLTDAGPLTGADAGAGGAVAGEEETGTRAEAWSFRARGPITSSPLVHAGRLYFGSRDGYVYCLDARTGEELWAHAAGSGVASSPRLAEGLVYVGTYGGEVLALDASTGERRWDVRMGGKIVANPALSDRAVIIGSHSGSMHSFDAATGRPLWALRTGSPVRASAEPIGDRVVFGDGDGTVRCLTARGGQLVWETELPAGIRAPAAAVAGGRRVVVADRDGTVACLDASTGRIRWTVQVGAEVNGRPTPAGDLVLVGTGEGRLVALEVNGGGSRWTARAARGFDASPLVIGDLVIAPSYDGQVHLFGLANGARRAARPLESEIWASPAASEGLMLVGTLGGTMHALPVP